MCAGGAHPPSPLRQSAVSKISNIVNKTNKQTHKHETRLKSFLSGAPPLEKSWIVDSISSLLQSATSVITSEDSSHRCLTGHCNLQFDFSWHRAVFVVRFIIALEYIMLTNKRLLCLFYSFRHRAVCVIYSIMVFEIHHN